MQWMEIRKKWSTRLRALFAPLDSRSDGNIEYDRFEEVINSNRTWYLFYLNIISESNACPWLLSSDDAKTVSWEEFSKLQETNQNICKDVYLFSNRQRNFRWSAYAGVLCMLPELLITFSDKIETYTANNRLRPWQPKHDCFCSSGFPKISSRWFWDEWFSCCILRWKIVDDVDKILSFMQACQFHGFSGFVLEKGKDQNLARLAAADDWVRQDQEEALEDDEVYIYCWHNYVWVSGTSVSKFSYERLTLPQLEQRKDRVDLFKTLIPQFRYIQTTTGKTMKGKYPAPVLPSSHNNTNLKS